MTPAESLLEALSSRGEAPFLRHASGSASAADVLELVRRAEDGLARRGLSAGDVMALWRVPPGDAVPLLLAAWSLGMVVHIADPREPSGPLATRLEEVRARLLIMGDVAVALLSPSTPATNLDGLFGSAPIDLAEREALDLPQRAATLMLTSGSSGRPKLAVHALSQFTAAARGAIDALELREGDGWLLSLPYHHVGGLSIIFRALLAGADLLIPEPGRPLGTALALMAPTHVSLVPAQLFRLLREDPDVLATPKRILLGGSALSASLRRRGLEAGAALAVSYGSTETTAFVAFSAEPDVVAQPGSAGRALPQREIVVDAEGEIRVGGPTLFLGYLEDGRLQDPRGADGRFATGDLGRLDADGVLYVLGRRDRMFISGGENIHPGEIEAALESLDGVDEAVVVAVPDEEFGERPVAFLACATPPPSRENIEAQLRLELAGFKIPRAFYHFPEAGAGLKRRPEELLAVLESGKGLRPI